MKTSNTHHTRTDAHPRGRTTHRVETIVVVIAVAVVTLTAAFSGHSTSARAVEAQTVRVSSGESLWTLATKYPVRGRTTAQTVDLIIEMNGLDSASIGAGATIQVPRQAIDAAVAMR